MIGRVYALLWSQQDNAIKIQPLDDCASLNRAAYADNTPGDYRLLLIGTRIEVDATAASIRPTLDQREAGRVRAAA